MPPNLQSQSITRQAATTPLISPAQREIGPAQNEGIVGEGAAVERTGTTGQRRFFGFGKKTGTKPAERPGMASSASDAPLEQTQASALRTPNTRSELQPQVQPIPISPARTAYPTGLAASPSILRSASPRRQSPASSEIFERNVQDPVHAAQLQGELNDAHIPSHVMTEDHIPPALEASAQAITQELNPDEVEIVMSASHQPAASVLESSTSHVDLTQLNNPASQLQPVASHDSEPTSLMQHSHTLPVNTEEDGASNYGQLDPNDVRRLSFISFADVVQSEHQAPASAAGEPGHGDSMHLSGFHSGASKPRAPSPLGSSPPTRTIDGMTTPPPLPSVVAANAEHSPTPVASHGELTIETLRQAVRKTASGDLSGVRSAAMSPASDENLAGAPRSRTNS